uniref:Uncharacterized protein n=1 Tax=Arion vulgaris TaxID=1028688 RepID=A0A0B7AAV9_9EUPU
MFLTFPKASFVAFFEPLKIAEQSMFFNLKEFDIADKFDTKVKYSKDRLSCVVSNNLVAFIMLRTGAIITFGVENIRIMLDVISTEKMMRTQ